MSSLTEVATLGGGCFWCLEAVFQQVAGVANVASGYAGGSVVNPTYEHVCAGTTGHAEVVQVTFDPTIISYLAISEIFFDIHDPTTLNYQGPDVGTQYRSVIFYHSDEQKQEAERMMASLRQKNVQHVTQLVPFTTFYPAEAYHRNYFLRNPDNAYCRAVIGPKLAKFRKTLGNKMKQ